MFDTSVQQRRRLFLISLATVGAALMLVITTMSATIRLSNAGLGCPDWPRCYGPRPHLSEPSAGRERPDGGVIIAARLVHRIAAVAVLVVIVAIGFACFGTRPVLWREGAVALALAALALFLAVLGRWTTGARLPAVALGNLLGGFAMLALFGWLRLRCAMAREPAAGADAPLRAGLVIAIGVLVLQIALGGLVSASFSALGCTRL